MQYITTLLMCFLAACHAAPSVERLNSPPEPSVSELLPQAATLGALAVVEVAEAAASKLGPALADTPSVHVLDSMLRCRQVEIEVALNNIANVNTPGFKRSVVHVTNQLSPPASPSTGGIDREGSAWQVGGGVAVSGVVPIFTPGVLSITDRNLDLAIDGPGFFAVELGTGAIAYTRDGQFHLDRDGILVHETGHRVVPQLTLPPDLLDVNFDCTGLCTGRTAGSPDTTTNFGQILTTNIINPETLQAGAGGLLIPTDATAWPTRGVPGRAQLGYLKQGFVERSNVQLVQEIATLRDAMASVRALRTLIDSDSQLE